MYADVAEDDDKKTGELRSGVYTGFPSILLNIFQATGVFILGLITSLPDVTVIFIPSEETISFSLGLVIWGPIASGVMIASYFYTKRFVELDFTWEKTELIQT
jgi:hypothetical protein